MTSAPAAPALSAEHSPLPWTKDARGNVIDANGDRVVVYDLGIPMRMAAPTDRERANTDLIWTALAALAAPAPAVVEEDEASDFAGIARGLVAYRCSDSADEWRLQNDIVDALKKATCTGMQKAATIASKRAELLLKSAANECGGDLQARHSEAVAAEAVKLVAAIIRDASEGYE